MSHSRHSGTFPRTMLCPTTGAPHQCLFGVIIRAHRPVIKMRDCSTNNNFQLRLSPIHPSPNNHSRPTNAPRPVLSKQRRSENQIQPVVRCRHHRWTTTVTVWEIFSVLPFVANQVGRLIGKGRGILLVGRAHPVLSLVRVVLLVHRPRIARIYFTPSFTISACRPTLITTATTVCHRCTCRQCTTCRPRLQHKRRTFRCQEFMARKCHNRHGKGCKRKTICPPERCSREKNGITDEL